MTGWSKKFTKLFLKLIWLTILIIHSNFPKCLSQPMVFVASRWLVTTGSDSTTPSSRINNKSSIQNPFMVLTSECQCVETETNFLFLLKLCVTHTEYKAYVRKLHVDSSITVV